MDWTESSTHAHHKCVDVRYIFQAAVFTMQSYVSLDIRLCQYDGLLVVFVIILVGFYLKDDIS